MSKISLYFPNQDAYDAYWGNDKPGSKYLCIIEDSGVEGVENVMITSSNNAPNSGGQITEMGASTVELIEAQQQEIETQYAIIDDYENDETVSKTEYNLVVDELNDAAEIAEDIKEG